MGVVISTAYDSMPPEAVAHIIQETQPKAVFTEVIMKMKYVYHSVHNM